MSGSDSDEDTGICCVCTCDSPATGIGPHSRQPKCPEHLVEDTEHVRRLQRELHDQLQPFTAASVESLQQQVDGATADIRAVQRAFASARESMTEWESRVVGQLSEKLEASKRCLLDRQDIVEYIKEEAETESSGDMQKLCQLVLSMLITVDSLKMDFDQEERARLAAADVSVSSVLQLNGLIGELSRETAGSAESKLARKREEEENRLKELEQQLKEKQQVQLKSQYEMVKQLNSSPLVKGDTWAVVSSRWVKYWTEYVGADLINSQRLAGKNYHPGPIDNSDIVEPNGKMEEGRLAEIDFTVMHKDAWHLLVDFYGTKSEPIFRKVIEIDITRTMEIEVYLLDIELAEMSSPYRTISMRFSRACPYTEVEATMRALFKVPDDRETRLWVSLSGMSYDLLTDKDQTLGNQVYNNQYLLLEVKGADGQWPCGGDSKKFSRSPASRRRGYLQATGGRFSTAAFVNAGMSGSQASSSSSSSSNQSAPTATNCSPPRDWLSRSSGAWGAIPRPYRRRRAAVASAEEEEEEEATSKSRAAPCPTCVPLPKPQMVE